MALQNFYPAAVDAVDLSLLLLSNIIQILTGLSQVRNEVFLKLKRGSYHYGQNGFYFIKHF